MLYLQDSDLASEIRSCKQCSARADAKCPIPGDGPENALIIFIGRNPGREEDLANRPFVGRSGKLLNEIFKALSLKRESCAVLNTVKCFTENNRTPTPEEISFCLPWLKKEFRFFKSKKVLIPLGSEAFKSLFSNTSNSISSVVGKVLKPKESGVITIPLFHPSYLLRNAREKTRMFNYILPRVSNYLVEYLPEAF